MTDHARRPLHGVRVVEFARWQPAAWIGLLLAQLGADVVKIEKPSAGEPLRHSTGLGDAIDPNHLAYNRHKRSVAVDYTEPAGIDLVHDLIGAADVALHDFRPGYAARYRLDWAEMSAANPGLVLAVVTGYGATSSRADLEAYDMDVQARAGIMSLTGTSGTGPLLAGITLGECLPALYGALAVTAALHERHTSGLGRHLDVAMVDCGVAAAGPFLQYALSAGFTHPPRGAADPLMPATLAVDCADGRAVYVSAIGDRHFADLCRSLDIADVAADPAHATLAGRRRHRDTINAALAGAAATLPSAIVVDRLTAAGVPCAPVNSMADVAADDHVRERGLIGTAHHATLGDSDVCGFPVVDSAAPRTHGAPSTVGEHTHAVLSELLALDDPALAALQDRGVIAGAR